VAGRFWEAHMGNDRKIKEKQKQEESKVSTLSFLISAEKDKHATSQHHHCLAKASPCP